MVDALAEVKHTISIGRLPGMTWRSKNSIGKDALHAVMSIPGAFDVEIQMETPEVAVIGYVWKMPQRFPDTLQYLEGRGLRRIDWL
jgi:hypothetical protein